MNHGEQPRKLTLMSWITGLMFLGGLAAGPAYYIYCVGFSGKEAHSASIVQAGNGYRPVVLNLDPAMNPVRLEVRGEAYRRSSGSASVAYRARLLDGRTPLLEKTFSFDFKHDDKNDHKTQSHALGIITIPNEGQYTLVVSGGETRNSDVRISNLEAAVWRNAKMANMKIVWWGIGVMVTGLILAGLTGELVPVRR
jgi:hypothetical protein